MIESYVIMHIFSSSCSISCDYMMYCNIHDLQDSNKSPIFESVSFFRLLIISLVVHSISLGVKYYDSKVDNPNKVITWEFGSGEFSPAVEEALLGTYVCMF